MEENIRSAEDSVKNVFKNGRKPTKEAFTKVWIDMINRMERQNAAASSKEEGGNE